MREEPDVARAAPPLGAIAIAVHYVEEEYASMFGKRCSTEQARRLVGVALQGLEDWDDWHPTATANPDGAT